MADDSRDFFISYNKADLARMAGIASTVKAPSSRRSHNSMFDGNAISKAELSNVRSMSAFAVDLRRYP
jgi:hypothetical protein